ncbi:hypothetical protein [Paenibacillus radicis (ex Gao et al. 2016)]|uniref:Uncharacterized protein n=1 Tax=Paenibacillus radicis (ex Gao et al. 2016) TaxID=1737354 RepID=A0A917GQ23_9BACL|nr:hypothetical protein [Paenibacillus radicis (ex Gao et al. 2016)]GGG53246.1 hypothetical protein GCM10010918_02390 [Paenibacillus radicis (ex Gao et al. 2016)]
MFITEQEKGLNLNRIMTLIPYIFAYSIFILEEDRFSRLAVCIALCIIFIIVDVLKVNYRVYGNYNNSYSAFFTRCIIVVILLSSLINDYAYFIFGLVSISIILYKIFEFFGDYIERILINKSDIPLIVVFIIKYMFWVIGFLVFVFSFFGFIIRFVNLYPNNSISSFLMKTDVGIITNVGVVVLSILNAIFILDFLYKWIIRSFKSISFNVINRVQIQLLFIKIAVIISFADITYSLLYLAFSGIKIEEVNSMPAFVVLLGNYVKSFYYAFCLHFSATLPTTSFFVDMDLAVKQKFPLQIIQFFHFCLNKIIDITVLAYSAGVILRALGITNEKSK